MKANGKRYTKNMLSNPYKHAMKNVWVRYYKDCRSFGQTRIVAKQAEIDHLLKVGVADEI